MQPQAYPAGFALLIVLWSVVLLALLAMGITATGRSQTQLAGNVRRAAAAQAAADGGVYAAAFHASDAPARAWLADTQPHVEPFGAYRLTIRIADEDRKINPNYASPELLQALMVAAGADRSTAANVAQAIADWHAPGARDPLVALYRTAGLAAAPTGEPFASVDEVGLVLGMTPDLLARLRPHLSIYAEGTLNFAQADPVIQAAMRSLGRGDVQPEVVRPTVLDITCDAQGRDGSRFIRHAVVALGQDRNGELFRTLAWEALPAG